MRAIGLCIFLPRFGPRPVVLQQRVAVGAADFSLLRLIAAPVMVWCRLQCHIGLRGFSTVGESDEHCTMAGFRGAPAGQRFAFERGQPGE